MIKKEDIMEENVTNAENNESVNNENHVDNQEFKSNERTEEKVYKEVTIEDTITVDVGGKTFRVPAELKPISPWGYFGYELLFTIPLVGLVMLIIFSLGGTKNINLRNFARSQFCVLLVILILCGIVFLFAGATTFITYFSGRVQ